MALGLPGGGSPTPYPVPPVAPGPPGPPGPAANYGVVPTAVTSYPDYAAILDRLLAPLKARLAAQQQALTSSVGFEENLGRDNARLAQEGLAQAHTATLKGIIDTLTAHGMDQSGDTHYRNDQENQQFSRASALGANQLLAYLKSLEDQLVQQAISASDQLATATGSAQDYIGNTYTPTTGYPQGTPGSVASTVGFR